MPLKKKKEKKNLLYSCIIKIENFLYAYNSLFTIENWIVIKIRNDLQSDS